MKRDGQTNKEIIKKYIKMSWRFFPRDFFCEKEDGSSSKPDVFWLESPCCKPFNEASNEIFSLGDISGVKFAKRFDNEMKERSGNREPQELYLAIVSSRFASDFKLVLSKFSRLLYCGLVGASPEECIYFTAQFCEAAAGMQSHKRLVGKPEDEAEWTRRETLSILMEIVARKTVCQSYYVTEEQRAQIRHLSEALRRFCKTIVFALMRIAYAEDRDSQTKFIHYTLLLARDILEEMGRVLELEREEKQAARGLRGAC